MPRPKKPKPHTQSYWKHKIDPYMSKLIREKGFCERCGRGDTLQDAHIVGRKNMTLRWDIFNHLCLCYQCHKFFWHEEPLESGNWFEGKFPERAEYLLKAKNIILAWSEEKYREVLQAIQEKDFERLVLAKF